MYKQLRPFNRDTAGRINGLCLQNVRKGFGIGIKYLTALSAWKNTPGHTKRDFPLGVATPLFYSYKTAGHVNVHLPNGEIWSDGTIYANLDAYLLGHPLVKYLGWSEYLNGVQVIQYVADPPKPVTPPKGKTLHLDKGTTTSTFNSRGVKVGAIYAQDNTYDYLVRGYNANRVIINSASGGGNGVEVALTYLNGQPIPGRRIK